MNKIRTFFQGYGDELLEKVHWPTVPELQSSTITVLIASLLIALVIALMDGAFSNIMKFLYGLA